MAIIGAVNFFIGIMMLIVAIFVYIRRTGFPYLRNATVVSTVCGSDECKISLTYTGTDDRPMTVNVYTDDRVSRKEMPIRISERDSSKVVIEYPFLYSAGFMAILFVTGFVLCTSGLTMLISAADGTGRRSNNVGSSYSYAAQQPIFV